MRAPLRRFALVFWLAGALPGLAATVTVQLDPPVVNTGAATAFIITIQNGTVEKVDLPQLDGLHFLPGISSTTYAFTSGTLITTTARKYELVAAKPGDYTIPPFDLALKDGTTLTTQEIKLHVNAAAPPADTPSATSTSAGPVVMPPANPSPAPSDNDTVATPRIPRDPDGGPAKVFMIITPQSTDAYVGEMVPVRIDFYIRQETNADQDSLPTLKGSDFLMNDFAVRGHASVTILENEAYEIDTFLSAFSAPKSGDFPLAAERDTYWVKSVAASGLDPFGFTRTTSLAHGIITSNQYTMHIRPLPVVGRPDNFSGAVGQFAVSADAQPAVIKAGTPVTVTFGVRGTGNFDYVHAPVLTDDMRWKVYPPNVTINFIDEERTQGAKTFELLAIPRQNGNVPMPRATFSFFNSRIRQYVTVPVDLPTIAVTGAMPQLSPDAATPTATVSSAPPPSENDFAPNQGELGDVTLSMSPVYRAPWFWVLQGALVTLPVLGLVLFLIRRWTQRGSESAESISRRRTLRQEESAMAEAVRRNDARTFFLAARHAVQLQLGTRWSMAPEAITLGEIRRHDLALAETVGPLFAQADEVLYSAHATANLDLVHWQRVARECLQLQAV